MASPLLSLLDRVVGVGIGEALELLLVDGGQEILVHRSQLGHLLRERHVEVGHVQRMTLSRGR